MLNIFWGLGSLLYPRPFHFLSIVNLALQTKCSKTVFSKHPWEPMAAPDGFPLLSDRKISVEPVSFFFLIKKGSNKNKKKAETLYMMVMCELKWGGSRGGMMSSRRQETMQALESVCAALVTAPG